MIIFFLIGYFAIMAGVAFFSRRKISNVSDYYIAGRSLPVWLAAPTIVATWYGAGSFLGVSSTVSTDGIKGVIADPFGCSLSLLIAAFFFASRFRKKGMITVNEVISNHYGRTGELVASWSTLPFYIGTLAAQMIAIGGILYSFCAIPFTWGILISASIILFYTLIGGMWSVTITDGIQLTILLATLLALFIPIFKEHALFSSTWSMFQKEIFDLKPKPHQNFGYLSYAGMWLMTGFGAMMGQDLVQRFFACKDAKTARNSTLIAAPLYLLLGMIPIFLGLYGKQILPADVNPENLIAYIVKSRDSLLLQGLFICGILSVTMSTADSYLLAGSSIVIRNIFGTDLYEKKALGKARLSAVAIILLALMLALFSQNIYALMVHSGVFLFVALFVPTTAALYLSRVFQKTGIISMTLGIGGWLSYVLLHYNLITKDLDNLLYAAALFGGICSLVSYIGAHTFYKLASPKKIKTLS